LDGEGTEVSKVLIIVDEEGYRTERDRPGCEEQLTQTIGLASIAINDQIFYGCHEEPDNQQRR